MLGSPGLDSLSSGSDMKYPGECYSPKFADQRDTYRGMYFKTDINFIYVLKNNNYRVEKKPSVFWEHILPDHFSVHSFYWPHQLDHNVAKETIIFLRNDKYFSIFC